ncbi:hypothetical protein [Bacillus cereus]|uniref:hypothetical protein n=1 Tax=Bacillus cereus TaxID=1396 RepID=UPI000BF4EAF3|nr:hypothetical protein [Bacillus cereus]PEY77764.1 hypothetical protein CN344_15995 [Bacillus cereus]PGP76690.1 hypothetical protein CN999_26580 [Bacillus cereus]
MADAPKLNGNEFIDESYYKINLSIDNANDALKNSKNAENTALISEGIASTAKIKASEATEISKSVQKQLDTIVVNGDSGPEAKQARTDLKGNTHNTLKERIDSDFKVLSKVVVDILNPPLGIAPAPIDGKTNIAETLNDCISYVNANGIGEVHIPYNPNGYTINSKVNLKSNVSLFFYGSDIKIPSSENKKFYAFSIRNCENVNFYGLLKMKSTNDKKRPIFSGLCSNVTGIDIANASGIYIESVYGENIEFIINIYGENLPNEKNIIIGDIQYLDCNFPFFAKQYSDVKTKYIHGVIQNLQMDPHDHVVYVNNNCYNIHFDVVQGIKKNDGDPVWMVQCDTNFYTDDMLSNNITFNSILIEGNFSGFVNGGCQNVSIGQLTGNVNSPNGTFVGCYSKSKCQISNITLEGSIKRFMSCLGTSQFKGEMIIAGGNINAAIGGIVNNYGYILRAEYTSYVVIRNVNFNNIVYGSTGVHLVDQKDNGYFLIENCQFNYNVPISGYLFGIYSGNVDIKGCKFVSNQNQFDQVIHNGAGTTVNVYNSLIKNFKSLLYYNPPSGAVCRASNCSSLDDNSVINEFNGYVLKKFYGVGSPEGVITAKVGSEYIRADGGAGTTYYVKQSGTGNTGWVGK